MSAEATARRVPVHLWVIGILGALWSAYGCFDYLMTQTRNASYLGGFPPALIEMVLAMPVWAHAAWALGVWGGLAGCILLLLRNRWALTAFRISLLGAAIGFAYHIAHWPPSLPRGASDWVMTAVILAVCIGLLIYARWQIARGVLR